MKDYYFVKNNKRIGPVSFNGLKKAEIKSDTLIWFNGLDKWMLAKNIPELEVILNNESSNRTEKTSSSKKKLSTIIIVVFFLVLSAIIFFYVNSDFKVSVKNENDEIISEESILLNTNEITKIIDNYYKSQDNRLLDNYSNSYEYPIKKYYTKYDVNQSNLLTMARHSWSLTTFHKNIPDFNTLEITKNGDNYFLVYNLTYKYILKKNNIDITNKYKVNLKMNKFGKIYFVETNQISSSKNNDLVSFINFEDENAKLNALNDADLNNRLLSVMRSYQYKKLKENWEYSSKVNVLKDEIYFYGCKESDCQNVNFIIVLDIKNNVIHSGTKLYDYVNTFSEDNSKNSIIEYWVDHNNKLFE